MNRLVFLLEERSMKVLLDGLLPRLVPGVAFLCVPHEGKQDLEKSVPKKLRAWREPGVHFVVLRDNDGGDCRALKARLAALCREGRREDAVVRFACQEIEAWYFGEPAALAAAFGDERLKDIGIKEAYREPDAIVCPSDKLQELVPEFQKVSGARRMASRLSRDGNRSHSYRVFMDAIDRATTELNSGTSNCP